MGVRSIGDEAIASGEVITPGEAVAAVEQAFRELGEGRASSLPRQRLQTKEGGPTDEPGTWYMFNCHVGVVPGMDAVGVRLNSRHRRIEDDAGRMTYPRDVDFVLLFDTRTCEPTAVMPTNHLSMLRVGATSAVGADRLARDDATIAGMVGSGRQARAHLRTLAAVRDLEECRVFSPTPAHRESFASELSDELGVDVRAVSSAERAVEGVDIVTLATNATEPVIEGAWLEPGMHLTSIVGGDGFYPRTEIDEETCRRADRFVVTDLRVAREDEQASVYPRIEAGILDADEIDELAPIVSGSTPGRGSADELTVFMNNTGMGIQFAATAARIYENAVERGVGEELPLEAFALPYSRV